MRFATRRMSTSGITPRSLSGEPLSTLKREHDARWSLVRYIFFPAEKVLKGTRGMGAKDVFAAVGLGSPFYFAAATYGFFHWLDRNASAPATRAISAWVRS